MMLDLDNLDLDLDEDFPTGPLEKNDLFESSFTGPLSWAGSKNSENSASDNGKTVQKHITENTPKKDEPNDPILKLLESAEKNKEKNDKEIHHIFRDNLNNSNILNTSFSPNKFFKNDVSDLNRSKDSGKRILTHRKFPGPAGLLPDKPLKDLSDVNVIVDSSLENVSAERQKESVILCSQTSSVFSEASFKKLASDFDLFKDNCPLNKYTVDWVKKRALKKTLCGKKIPFLAVVLHNLDHGTPDPVITLRDQTGEIYGTLHREVWAELGGKLQPGAALALRQVGVLITGIARRQVHLNITNNNIINIYSYTDEENVETNSVNKFDKNDLMKGVDEWQIAVSNAEPKLPSNPFSTFGGNKSHNMTASVKSKPLCKPFAPDRGNSKINFQQHNKTGHPSCSKNVEPKNCINFTSSMEDDMSDFLASLDDSDLGEKFLGGMKDPSACGNPERDNNIRKRKMDAEDVISSTNSRGIVYNRNGYVPPAKKMEYHEKVILTSQPLSQAESQSIEEVLDGLDFDDF